MCLEKRTSAAKAVKRTGCVRTARLNPCPSFDSLPQPLKVSEGFICYLANGNLIWTSLKVSRPYGTKFWKWSSHTRSEAQFFPLPVFRQLAIVSVLRYTATGGCHVEIAISIGVWQR